MSRANAEPESTAGRGVGAPERNTQDQKNRYDRAIRTWGRAIFQNTLPLTLGEAVRAGILSYIFNVPR